jgi:protein subunit release factor B
VTDKILLPDDDDRLLAECDVETFRSGGKGGQNVNKVETAVRIRHLPSGVVVTSQKERSQLLNKRACIAALRARVEKLNYRKPKRIKTRVPRSVKEKVHKEKRHQAAKKKTRSRRIRDDD